MVYRYKIYLITVDQFLTLYQIVQRDHKNEKKNMSQVAKCWNDIKLGLTIDANFYYRDSIAIVEITITILSLSWHTITILSRYYRFFTKLSLKGVYLEQSRNLSPFSAVG